MQVVVLTVAGMLDVAISSSTGYMPPAERSAAGAMPPAVLLSTYKGVVMLSVAPITMLSAYHTTARGCPEIAACDEMPITLERSTSLATAFTNRPVEGEMAIGMPAVIVAPAMPV